MEGRVDFPLERGRLLAPALSSGSLAPLGSAYADPPSLGRPNPMSDITRTPATPSTISALGHYPSRYIPPPMSVHSQGASFALMGGYLSGSGHTPESIKSLMPDMQQYWSPAHQDGYHRYVINNNLYPPYPFQLGSETLPLLPGGVGGAGAPGQQSTFAQHRIYELHKESYLANQAAVSQAGYFSLPGQPVSHHSRPSSPKPQPGLMTFKQETKYEPPPERPSKHSEKHTEKRTHSTKHESGKTEGKHKESERREKGGDGERERDRREKGGDADRREAVRIIEVVDDKPEKSEPRDTHRQDKSKSRKGDNSNRDSSSHRKSKSQDVHESVVHKESESSGKVNNKPSVAAVSGNVKIQSVTTLPTVTVTASGTTVSHSTSASSGSTHSTFTCVQPVTTATAQGTQVPPMSSVAPQGKTASALPYYHNMYSHPSGASPPAQGPKKVYATTFVPEVGTVTGPLDKARLCETRVKSETVRPSCCREKQGPVAKIVSCPPSSEQPSDPISDPAVKHSTKLSRRHPSGDNIKVSSDSPKITSVTSTGETGDTRVEGEVKVCEDRKDCSKTISRKSEHDSEALDYTTSSSSKSSPRVCVRHQVKSSPTKPVCATISRSEHRQTQPEGKPHDCPGGVVTSSSPDIKPDSTTPHEQNGGVHKQEKTEKREPGVGDSALNLTKTTRKGAKLCDSTQRHKDRTLLLRKSEVDKEKRCGSAPPQTAVPSIVQEEPEIDPGTEQDLVMEPVEKIEETQEHTGGNIPVGIAVARQRAEQPRGQDTHSARNQAPPLEGGSRGVGEEDERQYSQDREEFLRQQKALLSGQTKVTVNTGLPPNLVVTGSVAGSDPSLQDDPRVRPLANQWMATGHTVNPNPWLTQNPFALHPTLATTSNSTLDPNAFPATAPSGFKIAHDSFTGNLFLIPADYVEQGGGLWPFPGGHGHQAPPAHFGHLLQTSPHITAQIQAPESPQTQIEDEQEAETEHTSASRQSPDSGDQQEGSERGSEEQCPSRTTTPGSRPNSGSGKDKTPTPQSPPGTPASPADREKTINIQNPYIPDMTVATQQYTYPYPAGHLPYVFNPGLIPVPGMPVNLSEPLTVKTEPPTVQSRGTSPMVLTPPPSDETNRSEDPRFKEAGVFVDFPKPVTKCCASVQTCDPPPPAITLKEQCSQTCQELDLSRTETLLKAAEKLSKLTDSASQSEPEFLSSPAERLKTTRGPDYNPFTDPHILKAADGLELLSVLAEKRSKCVSSQNHPSLLSQSPVASTSTDRLSSPSHPPTLLGTSSSSLLASPTSLPSVLASPTSASTTTLHSPSESLQSDQLHAEETSSIDTDRAADVTPKREVKRGVTSPKWTFPKKDTNPSVLTIGGIKIPTGLEGMDAMEVEMRMRLAELQRRYKEKQRELAKLQPRNKDGGHGSSSGSRERRESRDSKDEDKEKRKPGRPRKRKFFSKKKDEDSPSKAGNKESHPKKKRLPEELVDRVFRKLPPVKSDKLKTMRTKSGFLLKRRTSSSSGKMSQEGTSQASEGFLCKSSTFGERKFFKSKGANIAKGKFKPFAKRKDLTSRMEVKPSAAVPSDTGNLFSNIENSLAERKRPKSMLKGIERQTSRESSEHDTSSTQAVSPSMLESGLGLLAKFATSALTAANMKKKKRKMEEASDTEMSDTPSINKKRKPGRPKKCTPISTGGGTETIVSKKSRGLGLLHLSDVAHSKDKKPTQKGEGHRQVKLEDGSHMKPLYLDEEWCLRRSERIFLSEPSPQPSPNNQQPGKPEARAFFSHRPAKGQAERDRDRAKVQKAKSLQELSQKVKRKYSKNLGKKTSFGDDRLSRGSMKARIKQSRVMFESDSDQESGSGSDDIPLSALRRRPETPEPRSCVMRLEDLSEGLRVLEFQDGLFYEGAVKAINPPDIYGVVVDNQRGNRPHIYPQEEILKNVIVDVKAGSPRFLPEGTRVCAYWSQQFSCLYPGTVAKTSPNPHSDKYSVNVEFDDGDSGRIPIDHIRLLPPDFPLVLYDPNPLLNLSKRRRRTTSDDSDFRKSIDSYFSMNSEGKKRTTSKRDTFSSGQFDETVEEEDSEDPDVFESDMRRKSQEHTQRSTLQEGGQKQTSHFGKGFQSKDNLGMTSLSPRRDEAKSSSLIRPSAFDMNKFTFQYGGGSGTADEESSSDEDDVDSSDDECNTSSASSDSDSPDEGNASESSERKKVGRKSAAKHAAPKKKRSEKSQSSGLMPGRQLWKWSGKSTKRPGLKGKAKKEFYKAIVRGRELIKIGDCAIFLSTGRPNLPFIGRIQSMWESWGGQMTVRVKWFYHPEETKGGKKLADPRGALFESPHEDENDVQTISHKCDVETISEFKRRRSDVAKKGLEDLSDLYYLAGYYDPTIGLVKYEPDVL